MEQNTAKPAESQPAVEVPVINNNKVEESLLVTQRLRNLCELAISIGQKKGLLGTHQKDDTVQKSEGGEDVTDQGIVRERDAAQAGKDKAGD